MCVFSISHAPEHSTQLQQQIWLNLLQHEMNYGKAQGALGQVQSLHYALREPWPEGCNPISVTLPHPPSPAFSQTLKYSPCMGLRNLGTDENHRVNGAELAEHAYAGV